MLSHANQCFNELNVKKYKDHEENYYTCMMCGRCVSLSDSYSSKGNHLVCTNCINKITELFGYDFGSLITNLHRTAEGVNNER